MFCRGEAQTPPPPTLVMDMPTNGGGAVADIQIPGSIPAGFHVYSNGNNPPQNPQNPISNPQNFVETVETVVQYRECQRNHAVNMGGYAVDGCGEFLADEEDVLKCAACGCHRNFHRREIKGEEFPPPCELCVLRRKRRFSGGAASSSAPGSPLAAYYSPPLPSMTGGPPLLADSDDPDNNNNSNKGSRKRFRTKFSQEQKERMYLFAERVGWRMQKQDEVAVQQFCSEVGVEKGVLKVWMHNNKNTLGKKP